MEISIVHPSLNKAGGAERYCLEMIDTLVSHGHRVKLYTIDKTDWEMLRRTHSLAASPSVEAYLQSKTLAPDGVFSWLRTANAYVWLLIRGCEESELCINNYGEIMPFFADISIVHSVPMGSNSNNSYGIPFWGIMRRVYQAIYGFMDTRYGSEKIITNSRYNAEKINKQVTVIHPPVQLPPRRHVEKNGEILTVARIKPTKDLLKIAEIAASSPRYKFNVAGKTEYGSERLIRELRAFKNITVYANPRRDDLLDLMNRCSVYLSTQSDEAFGMAIVEAMSLDCIPVVYRSGGPWSDIFGEEEEVGLAYTSTEMAAEKIREIMRDDMLRRRLRENAERRAQDFTSERFRARFIGYIDKIEPHTQQDNRFFKIYRWMESMRSRFRESVRVIQVPL